MIRNSKAVSLLLTGVIIMGLLSLFGCVKKTWLQPKGRDVVDGGKVDNTDHTAPKEIKSDKISFFSAEFFLYCEGDHEKSGRYWFEVKADDVAGKWILSERYSNNISCEVSDTLLSEIQKIIERHELVKRNGVDVYTRGLPAEHQPSFLAANYESGERLYFQTDNDPYAAWAKELFGLVGKEFAAAGDNRFLVSNGELILKDRPEEGDLIKGERFYAQVPRNRYGAFCKEDDYAAGKFLLWLNRVMLSESGEIVERDEIAVPYIVNYDGNEENLSMLSGGMDGDKPYGDSILEITTDENGDIIDAVFIED